MTNKQENRATQPKAINSGEAGAIRGTTNYTPGTNLADIKAYSTTNTLPPLS
jgi:hypothetical protein